MNFAVEVVERARPDRPALIELARDGSRRAWSFGDVAAGARAVAGRLHAMGVRRGDVVLTLIGNRPEWVLTMVACFRQGYVVLPCNEQLRPKDLAQRLEVANPAAVVADERNREVIEGAGWEGPTLWAPWDELTDPAPEPAELALTDPCLITFTSGTSGEPKGVRNMKAG